MSQREWGERGLCGGLRREREMRGEGGVWGD